MKNKTYTIKSFKEHVKANKFSTMPTVTKDYEIMTNETNDGLTSTFKITQESPDREQDVVFANGLDITNYLKNPVVLWGHNTDELPIGKCVNIKQVEDGWIATVEFVPEDFPYIGAKAEAVRRSIKEGFLHAVSIGFIPKEWSFNEAGGFDILESELTEFSIVSVPCMPDAIVEERSLSLNTTEPLIPEDVDVQDDEEIEHEDQEQEEDETNGESSKAKEKRIKLRKLRFEQKKFAK